MITPQPLRAVGPADVPVHAPVPDLRTWWQRNAAAVGTIIGSALLTILAGTGGMTGLAHVAGIATVKDTAAIDAQVVAVVKAQQTAAAIEAAHDLAVNKKLDAIAKDAKAARAATAPRTKKKAEPTGGTSE